MKKSHKINIECPPNRHESFVHHLMIPLKAVATLQKIPQLLRVNFIQGSAFIALGRLGSLGPGSLRTSG